MKKHLINACFVLLAFASFSCKKEYDDNSLAPLDQAYAPIPVTVTNAAFFERFYGVNAASIASGGEFSITLAIPADKGKIKEISRVATGPSGLAQVQNGTSAGASLLYNYNKLTGASAAAVPIPGNGTNTITFTSKLRPDYSDYQTRVGLTNAPIPVAVSTNAQVPNQINFFFLITLEDGTTLIPPLVRVRIVQ